MHYILFIARYPTLVCILPFYSLLGDGFLQEPELRQVMKACMEENGMKFDERDLESLVQALYQDAIGSSCSSEGNFCDRRKGITIDDFKTQMAKHEGLLENLSIRLVVNLTFTFNFVFTLQGAPCATSLT